MIRPATEADLPALRSLLVSASLPVVGVVGHLRHFWVLEADGAILGVVGYEAYPPDALLRSLAVAPSVRGRGYGRLLIGHILARVRIDGVHAAYALTTTIPDVLRGLGFDEVSRSEAPEALLASEEFRGACPSSARLFRGRVTANVASREGTGGLAMDEKVKELIAVGASVGAHCQPCLTFHVAKAKEIGIEEAEIREAIAIGHMVEKGAMSAMRSFSATVFDAPATAAPSCCSGGKPKGKSCCA